MGISFIESTVTEITKDADGLLDASTELQTFMNRLQGVFRGVKFVKMRSNKVWVYYPDEPYPMGYIGYGDFRTEVCGDDQYMVASRKITNDKYGDYQDQFRMKMSGNMDTAIRNAKRFLRNFSPHEMAGANAKLLRSKANDQPEMLGSKFRKSMRELFDHEVGNRTGAFNGRMLTELRHLVDSDHGFVDGEFGHQLKQMFEMGDAWRESFHKTVNVYFVRVFEKFGKQTFQVTELDDVRDYNPRVSDQFLTYTDDLPEDIMGKLAVLSMTEDGNYVDDVGMRVDEGMFYVVR